MNFQYQMCIIPVIFIHCTTFKFQFPRLFSVGVGRGTDSEINRVLVEISNIITGNKKMRISMNKGFSFSTKESTLPRPE